MRASSAFSYRPEIDGLRAVAVVPVILYHAGYSLFSGGFVGVDIFFVISGYLISSLILKELDGGSFSFLAFFERRARRIFPALVAMVLGTLLIALVLFFPGDLKRLGSSMASIATFLSNILFSRQTGYFNTASELKPLIHTWSLAVEEQFYLFFPPLLFALWRLGARAASAIFVILLITSLVAAELTVRTYPDIAFYYPHTRIWELLSGVLAGIFLHRTEANWSTATRNVGSWAGLALIGCSFFLIDSQTPFPGLFAIPPVMGTVLIILFARDIGAVRSMLGWKPVVAIGLASYSAYLWHQPILAFARHLYIPDPNGIVMPIAIILSVFVAFLSWRYVEAPFRNQQKFSRLQILLGSALSLSVIFVVGVALSFSNGLPGRFSPEVLALKQAKKKPQDSTEECTIHEREPGILHVKIAACYQPGNTLYLIGDSHARSISPAIRQIADREGITLIVMWESACMPIQTAAHQHQSSGCTALKAQMRALTREFPAPVILSSRWRRFIQGNPFNNSEGGQEFGLQKPIIVDGKRSDDPIAVVEQALLSWARDVPLIVVDTIPEAGWSVKRVMARHRQLGIYQDAPLTTSYATYLDASRDVIAMFDRLERAPAISVVRTAPMVCSEKTGRCLNERGGQALYVDDDHPDLPFSQDIARSVFEQVRNRDILASMK